MILLPHPSAFLSVEVADTLAPKAAEAELNGDLSPDQLKLIYEQQWFRMLLPEVHSLSSPSSLPLSLPQLVRLEEGLAFADGSVGWTVTLCSGAGWFAGFFPEGRFDWLFADPRLCIAGSGSPAGEAHITGSGYRVSGRWPFASGILHATAF